MLDAQKLLARSIPIADIRARRIVQMKAEGITNEHIQKVLGVSEQTILLAQKKFPLEEAKIGVDAEQRIIPIADETDVLASGMAAAMNKLTRSFIKLAMDLNDEEMKKANPALRVKFLATLAPIIKPQIKKIAPKQVNFFIGKDKTPGTAEDLEKKLLEYATDQSKKTDED